MLNTCGLVVTNVESDTEYGLLLNQFDINLSITDTIAELVLIYHYVNELDTPIECSFAYPLDKDYLVSKMHIQIDDKEIESKIMEKEEAKEKYDEAIAGGKAAVMLREENDEILELDIGNILPG